MSEDRALTLIGFSIFICKATYAIMLAELRLQVFHFRENTYPPLLAVAFYYQRTSGLYAFDAPNNLKLCRLRRIGADKISISFDLPPAAIRPLFTRAPLTGRAQNYFDFSDFEILCT